MVSIVPVKSLRSCSLLVDYINRQQLTDELPVTSLVVAPAIVFCTVMHFRCAARLTKGPFTSEPNLQ